MRAAGAANSAPDSVNMQLAPIIEYLTDNIVPKSCGRGLLFNRRQLMFQMQIGSDPGAVSSHTALTVAVKISGT